MALEAPQVGEVLEWYLLSRRRDSGFGRKLLVHGLTVLKRRQFERAVIWLPTAQSRAIEVVDRMGFARADLERFDNDGRQTVQREVWIRSLDDLF